MPLELLGMDGEEPLLELELLGMEGIDALLLELEEDGLGIDWLGLEEEDEDGDGMDGDELEEDDEDDGMLGMDELELEELGDWQAASDKQSMLTENKLASECCRFILWILWIGKWRRHRKRDL